MGGEAAKENLKALCGRHRSRLGADDHPDRHILAHYVFESHGDTSFDEEFPLNLSVGAQYKSVALLVFAAHFSFDGQLFRSEFDHFAGEEFIRLRLLSLREQRQQAQADQSDMGKFPAAGVSKPHFSGYAFSMKFS